jgi:hypothetical protein
VPESLDIFPPSAMIGIATVLRGVTKMVPPTTASDIENLAAIIHDGYRV